tara:strand:+ start:4729 stop:5922 length:1194 start_codon:yes stop_codon:yes gene_type:complete
MSEQLINLNTDLTRLRAEGFDVQILSGLLLLRHVPYVTSKRSVAYGILACPLDLSGEKTIRPSNHKAQWDGEFPCFPDGTALEALRHEQINQKISDTITLRFSFSNKPKEGYADFFEKMSRYTDMISAQATAIEPTATAKAFHPIATSESESVFCFADTATSRAGITDINNKLAGQSIGIIGLGGTGASILDHVSKTPVDTIYLFDGDDFLSHNAFRIPGAASLDELAEKPTKVDYFARRYAHFRHGIVPHACFIRRDNLSLLDNLDFVFVCVDSGQVRKLVGDHLSAKDIPFIDVGMGLNIQNGKILGSVRTTISAPGHRDAAAARIPMVDSDVDNAYTTNIQVAELNALNAIHAVIRWKKFFGFYGDQLNEVQSVYTVEDNDLVNIENEPDQLSE